MARWQCPRASLDGAIQAAAGNCEPPAADRVLSALRTGMHMAYSLAQATGINRTTILRAKDDLIGLLLGHFSGSRRAAPRCRIALRVFTPSGMPAVKIRCQ
jgi:hypothetical protein